MNETWIARYYSKRKGIGPSGTKLNYDLAKGGDRLNVVDAITKDGHLWAEDEDEDEDRYEEEAL